MARMPHTLVRNQAAFFPLSCNPKLATQGWVLPTIPAMLTMPNTKAIRKVSMSLPEKTYSFDSMERGVITKITNYASSPTTARAKAPVLPKQIAKVPKQALASCQEITRQHSKTFYLGSLFFVPEQRLAVWAVYAACRLGDDIVDESDTSQVHEQLDNWWQQVQGAFAGRAGNSEISQALAWAAARYPIPLSAFAELHQGLLMDLQGYQYHNMADLLLYCRRVAGVVGFMIAPIAGYSGGEATLQQALKLGQAMQLTNILRDVGEDLRRGRVYLPSQLMAEYGVSYQMLEQSLSSGVVTPQYRALMQYLCQLAHQWYAESRAGIPCLHGPARLAVSLAACAYEGILYDLAKADYNNFNRRAHVSSLGKWLLLPRACWQSYQPPHSSPQPN